MLESTTDSYNALLRAAINTALESPNHAIKSDSENNPVAPVGEYASVAFTSSDYIGTPGVTNNVNEAVSHQFSSSMFSLIFNRGLVFDRSKIVKLWLMSTNGLALLRAANVGLTSISAVRNISVSLAQGRETRAQIDVTINHVDKLINIAELIDSLTISGVFHGAAITHINNTMVGI